MTDENKKTCFVIAPIGEQDSDTRKRADQVLQYIIRPAVESCGYKAVRADEIPKPGIITSQIIQLVADAPLVVADLTERNPNVFYELAIRHMTRKPLVQIISEDEKLPFDIASMRTIWVDHQDLDSVENAKIEITRQIKSLEADSSSLENPISVAVDIPLLRQKEKETNEQAEAAKRHVDEIKKNRDISEELVRHITMNAEVAANDSAKAKQAVEDVRENPRESLTDKAISTALDLQRQGENDKAIEKWRAIAGITEGTDNDLAARAWFSVGYLLHDKDSKGAILAYDRAIDLTPDYAEAYFNRGATKSALGDLQAALADYDEAVRLNPDLAETYLNRGNAKSALGDPQAALADYDEAIRLTPDYAAAYFNRGNTKGTLGDLQAALTDYDEAIHLNPDLAAAYFNRGATKSDLGDLQAALADYDEAIRLTPDHAAAYNNRGNTKRKLGDPQAALADYDEAIRLTPDHAAAYYNRGLAKSDLGQYEAALADYDEAIRLTPDLAEAYTNRGATKSDLGDPQAALADYDEAIRLTPDHAAAYNNRGLAKRKLGDPQAALADYDKAVRLQPDLAEAHLSRGATKSDLGDLQAAVADYDKAVRLQPDYAEAYHNRGIAKAALNQIEEAQQDFTTARDLARKAGNDSLVALAERRLRDLANRGDV